MGFESIVRPSVLPNIRPSGAQKVVFNDPAEGFAAIHGNPAKQLNLTRTVSISINRSSGVEVHRRVDKSRVYQVTDDGVNKDNYVDIEVTNKLIWADYLGRHKRYYKRLKPADNIEILDTDTAYNRSFGGGDL
jgi:hypothetical protein